MPFWLSFLYSVLFLFLFFAYLIFSFLKGKLLKAPLGNKLALILLIGRNIEEKGKQRYEKQKFEERKFHNNMTIKTFSFTRRVH